jgi:hypothetical protein
MTQAVGSVPGTLIDWAAGVIGIPPAVVAAQISEESGGNPAAVSPTGAQGVAQFEPGTWASEGCSGSPGNVNDAMKCYAKYMYQLLGQEHGSVRDALAAYNAGPGNLQAGYGYADIILRNAGQPAGLAGRGGTGDSGSAGATLTSYDASACIFGFPGITLPGVLGFGGGTGAGAFCVLSKSEARALVGAGLMMAGWGIGLVGAVILAASAFHHVPGADQALQAAGRITPAGLAERELTRREQKVSGTERRRRLERRERRAARSP